MAGKPVNRDWVVNLCKIVDEIDTLVETLEDLADEKTLHSNASERNLRKFFSPYFADLANLINQFVDYLKPLGVNDRDKRALLNVVRELEYLAGYVTDPDEYDYFRVGLFFLNSVIGLAVGRSPYFRNGGLSDALANWREALRVGCKLMRIGDLVMSVGGCRE